MNEVWENEEQVEGFKVTDDHKADWAIEKIKEIEADQDRLINLAQDKINELKNKIDDLKADKDTKTSYFKGLLREYMQTVETTSTKTADTYKLLAGTLKIKRKAPTPVVNNDKLVKWLKDNNYEDEYIARKEAPMWGEYKKMLTATDKGYVTADGEVVGGVTLKENEDVFEVI